MSRFSSQRAHFWCEKQFFELYYDEYSQVISLNKILINRSYCSSPRNYRNHVLVGKYIWEPLIIPTLKSKVWEKRFYFQYSYRHHILARLIIERLIFFDAISQLYKSPFWVALDAKRKPIFFSSYSLFGQWIWNYFHGNNLLQAVPGYTSQKHWAVMIYLIAKIVVLRNSKQTKPPNTFAILEATREWALG